jgi:Leucine-rich repeat (LRR) protein
VTQYDQVPREDAPDNEERQLFRMTQRFAMATFFYSLGLGSWIESTVSECLWGNATCSSDSEVIALMPAVAVNGGGGALPREIGLLTNLASLDLNFENVSSSIPTEVGQLSALTYLDIYANDLTSTIPTELGQLKALETLYLGENRLSSSVPTELGQLSDLKFAYLHSNALTSTIPVELGALSNLFALALNGNQLVGSVPSELCHIAAIVVDCSEVSCDCCSC